jgi:DNA-binding transcriptional regulator YhcF (GntR family)
MPPRNLQIRVEVAGAIPAYRQIVDQFRTLIIEGALRPGDALPAVRRLALDLGIHFNTVAEAYRLLAREGFLEIVHGHGARVLGRTAPRKPDPEVADDFQRKLRGLVAGIRARGLSARRIAGELRGLAEALENG